MSETLAMMIDSLDDDFQALLRLHVPSSSDPFRPVIDYHDVITRIVRAVPALPGSKLGWSKLLEAKRKH